MTTESEPGGPADPDAVPTMECRVCEVEVPAAKYCGLCGIHLTKESGDGPDWLRVRAYAAAPSEHLLQPSVASTLFPHLPSDRRTPFRLGLLVVLVALIAATLFKLPAVLVAVGALGLPLLFLIYLRESDAYRDLPVMTVVLTVVLGAGIAVIWVMLTGAAVARSYGVPLGVGVAASRVMREGLVIPLTSALLMLVPAVVVRLLGPPTRETLDGYMIGALGALSFTGAATLTRLAPQFATGLVARNRSLDGLMVEAGIRGVAVPVTAAAVGGLVGAALWFHRRAGHTRGWAVALALGVAVVASVYAGLGVADVAKLPQMLQLFLYLLVAGLALLALRVGLHLALLHEQHDEAQATQPMLCPHCHHVVPDMPFCPACGAANRASSRSSRDERRQSRPVRNLPPASGTA